MPNSERQSAWVSPGIAWIHTDSIRLFDNMIYSVSFRPTTVQMPNLALIDTKCITVYVLKYIIYTYRLSA